MEEKLTELQKTLDLLAANKAERERLIQYRDRQLRALRKAGATWVKLQDFAGLSPRGLKLALDRK